MKKALLLVAVLFISVCTTACINNLAVQELNTKAKEFMDKGEYQSAIERLKSSLDLDNTIFETHYNLAVAYTQNENYEEAIEAYEEVIGLKPDFEQAYYSKAICEENFAKDLIAGTFTIDDNDKVVKHDDTNSKEDFLSEKVQKKVAELLDSSIENYRYYLDKSSDENLRSELEAKIVELEGLLVEYKSKED